MVAGSPMSGMRPPMRGTMCSEGMPHAGGGTSTKEVRQWFCVKREELAAGSPSCEKLLVRGGVASDNNADERIVWWSEGVDAAAVPGEPEEVFRWDEQATGEPDVSIGSTQ